MTTLGDLIAQAPDPFGVSCARYVRAPLAFVREILGAEPDPWQADALRQLARGATRISVRSGHGVGKAEPLTNTVPTPDGRRAWGDIKLGDRLFGRSGEPVRVVARHEDRPERLYRLTFDDGCATLCGEFHLWSIRCHRRGLFGEWRTVPTHLLAKNFAGRLGEWQIPAQGLASYPGRPTPIMPAALGAYLAGGQPGEAVARAMGRQLQQAGCAYSTAESRSIPRDYLENSAAVRLTLLQSLMDHAGYVDETQTAAFATPSPPLAADVAELVRSLGGKAIPLEVAEATDPAHWSYQKIARLRVLMPPGVPTFTHAPKQNLLASYGGARLTRHITAIEDAGEADAMCVTVSHPDGLYLTGDYIATHNSAFAAWVMTWFANTRAPFKIGVTAPSAPQLFDTLWPELGSWFQRLPPAWYNCWDITGDRIALKLSPNEAFITARTARADKPEALQGLHSPNLLLVVDEASGVDEPVFESARGSMSTPGAITVLLGNPTRATGFFWRTHNLESARWWTKRVSSSDSLRVDPAFCQEIADAYGIDSNAYRVRVLGEFPASDGDTLIGAQLVEQAMARNVPLDLTIPEIWGVDVARFGPDASSLVKRRGYVVPEMPRRWYQADTMQLSGGIKAEWDLAGRNRPGLIVIDVIGIGSGVVDRLLEQNLPVLGINVSETPSMQGRYMRLRDELWDRGRAWLETRQCRLPFDDKLRDQLCSPRYTHLSDGKLQVESKAAMKSRGLKSPDDADAFLLTFAAEDLGVASAGGGGLFDKSPVRVSVAGME